MSPTDSKMIFAHSDVNELVDVSPVGISRKFRLRIGPKSYAAHRKETNSDF